MYQLLKSFLLRDSQTFYSWLKKKVKKKKNQFTDLLSTDVLPKQTIFKM